MWAWRDYREKVAGKLLLWIDNFKKADMKIKKREKIIIHTIKRPEGDTLVDVYIDKTLRTALRRLREANI